MLRGIIPCGLIAVLGFALVADAAPRKTDKKVTIDPPATLPANPAEPDASAPGTEATPAHRATRVERLPEPTRSSSRGAADFVLLPFQGILTDDIGTPLEGSVNLDLAIYDLASGGVPLWSETRAGEPVAAGLVSFSLGLINSMPAAIFDGSARWLGIRVNGDPEMPRVRLDATAHSAHAETADLATSVAAGSIGSVEIADNAVSGADILNGSITASDIASNSIGAAQIASSAVGNSELASSAVSGAKIASNAVTSNKVLDEAGTAYASTATDVVLTVGLATNVVQRTIVVPTSGFILANGRANFQIEHTGGIASEIFLSVSANSGVLDTGNLSRVRVTSPDSFGAYRESLAVTDVFSVGAGSHTFYMVAESDEGLGSDRVMDANLSLLFVPTSYGSVSRENPGPDRILADDR